MQALSKALEGVWHHNGANSIRQSSGDEYSSDGSSSVTGSSIQTSIEAGDDEGGLDSDSEDVDDSADEEDGSEDEDSDADEDEGDGGDKAETMSNNFRRSVINFIPGLRFSPRRRNREFHRLFPQVPSEEPLIAEYSCALARDILLQGRAFITPSRLCFHSNIFGYVVRIALPISTIKKVEPRNTAGIFPNAIAVTTDDGKKYSFHSFVNRDGVMRLIRRLRSYPPNSTATASLSRQGTQQRQRGDESEESPAELDNDRPGLNPSKSTDSMAAAVAAYSKMADDNEGVSSDNGSPPAGKSPQRSRKSSLSHSGANGSESTPTNTNNGEFGPTTHAPTKLPPTEENEKVLATETIKAPLGQVAALMFGKKTSWIRRFITTVEKNRDLTDIPDFAVGDNDKKSRYYEYTKPLNGPVGPKQTRCKCTETINNWDLEDHIAVIQSTVTPDVPSGNAFTTMTSICMSWGENNSTRLRLGTWIEWSGKTWLKGPIEKGAMDGQASFCKHLVAEIDSTLHSSNSGSAGAVASSTTAAAAEKPKKKKRHTRHKPQEASSSQPDLPGLFQIIVLVIVVTGIVWAIIHKVSSSRNARESQKDLRFVQQELELWQWIDDRSHADVQRTQSLSDPEVQEVIRITEMRLNKLREALGVKGIDDKVITEGVNS